MGFELDALHGQGDVDEGLMVEEVLKDTQEVVLVVVPPQAVLLRLKASLEASTCRGSSVDAWRRVHCGGSRVERREGRWR